MEFLTNLVPFTIAGLAVIVLFLGIKVVPQSKVFIIERFGKYTKTLDSGLSFIQWLSKWIS
jgi:regulator of protease activity HflC (stomatin/prohibitin superfamily)